MVVFLVKSLEGRFQRILNNDKTIKHQYIESFMIGVAEGVLDVVLVVGAVVTVDMIAKSIVKVITKRL